MSETLMTAEATTTPAGSAESEQATTTATVAEGDGQQQASEAATEGQKLEVKPEGAPEKYEFTPPEGKEFDAATLEQFSEVAKELNLSNESAQKMLDKIAPVLAEKYDRVVESARSEWAESSRSDKEFGGDKLDENLAVARKAMDTFGTPELRSLLNESGLGNHPEVIRMMYRAGKAISEDKFVTGGQGAAQSADARRLYSASNMNP